MTTAQGIGAQDDDMIEMHNESGTFVTTAGWVWAECLRESARMRREAWAAAVEAAPPSDTFDTDIFPVGTFDHYPPDGRVWEAERERGIPAWPVKEAQR